MSRIKQFWEAQTGRRFLFLPLLFALGIAIYFVLPFEPDWRILMLAAALFGALAGWQARTRLLWAAILIVLLGAGWAALHTHLQHPQILTREIDPRPLAGRVADIERVEKGVRLTLNHLEIRGLAAEDTPHRVRLTIRLKPESNLDLPRIGDRISLMAGLLPPMGAALPGGFDFACYFYFRDIGAVGYGLPPWEVVEPVAHTGFAQWRIDLTGSIIRTLGPERGPIAAGLITGEARAIRDVDFQALRASNLYHIIAISGGHMVVITGVIFVGLRLLFLLVPWGLRPQAKSVAAGLTLVMVTLYLFVIGLPISAVRAYVMIALVLIAVILRRDADAMRSLMLAALFMLIFDPSDLLEPGFQLSFVATLAIVALVEGFWHRALPEDASWARHAMRAVASMILISFVAEMATTLLVARAFNNFGTYGVIANALATPLVAVLIMPAVALFFIALPFGLEHPALWLMDQGVRALLWIARTVSSWPHAQLFPPSPPGWGVALGTLGLIWLCLIPQRLRWIGLFLMIVGWASIFTVRPPDLLVGAEAKQIALRTNDGYALVRGRSESLVPQLWANGLGARELPELDPGTDAWRCDRMGCIARVKEKLFAFPVDAVAVSEDCQRVSYVISALRTRACAAPIIDGFALERLGVHVFWIDGDRITEQSGADWQGVRPWSVRWNAKPAAGE